MNVVADVIAAIYAAQFAKAAATAQQAEAQRKAIDCQAAEQARRNGEGNLASHYRMILEHEARTLMRAVESQEMTADGKIKVQAPVQHVKRGVNHGQT